MNNAEPDPRNPAAPALEALVESVLVGGPAAAQGGPDLRDGTAQIFRSDARAARVVILGGGTGLSTVIGGNNQLPGWAADPFAGLKEEFPRLQVIVGTTDDGGSTGRLLQQLPMIAIGDLRKCCVSLIRSDRLRRRYHLDAAGLPRVVQALRIIFNHRFPDAGANRRLLGDPARVLPPELRRACPPELRAALAGLGASLLPGGGGPVIAPAGHCLGNLLLTAAVFQAAGGRLDRPPTLGHIRRGLDAVGRLLGVAPGALHPLTATPGQLLFRYANGVAVLGQAKAARVRRGCSVARVQALFHGPPLANAAAVRALRAADLIVYAPGSLYSSIIPLLQVPAITAAIRANRRALKILGANFWVQAGETDISPRRDGRDFHVSELIEAYDRNVPGGAAGLFHVVLSANLERMPGHILRNYALEGKRPIHLDRARVAALGVMPVEATLYTLESSRAAQVIQHDARKFALAVRALWYARTHLGWLPPTPDRAAPPGRPAGSDPRSRAGSPVLCRYLAAIRAGLAGKQFAPASLKALLLETAWDNRDLQPDHLRFFRGIRAIPAPEWPRTNEWDNVLSFYDPADQFIKIHAHLLDKPEWLRADLLIALGESLLGCYMESRRWLDDAAGWPGVRCYEIRLRPPAQRGGLLTPRQMDAYLRLARMLPDPRRPRCYRLVLNGDEGFLPPGLLFGLLYAWYLDNRYGGFMDYEMSLLLWPRHALIPHQAQEQMRKQGLVDFFRREIFGHPRD